MTLEEATKKLKELETNIEKLKDEKHELEELIDNLRKEYWVAEIVYKNTDRVEYRLLGKGSYETVNAWSRTMLHTHNDYRSVNFWGMSYAEYEAYRLVHDFKEFKLRAQSYVMNHTEYSADKIDSLHIDYLVEHFIAPAPLNRDFIDEEEV